MDNNFNNMFNPSSEFDTFNGTELKCYIKVTTEYDEYGQTKKFELVELGTISSISAVEQYNANPIPAIGASKPIGIAVGSSIVVGSASFEILSSGFVKEIQRVLKEAGINKTYLDYDFKEEKPNFGYSDIEEIQDFPLFDIVIMGAKENNHNKKIQMEILGIRFNENGSGIGLNQLGVRETYNFIAQSMNEFKPVIGVEEKETETITEDSIFNY